MYTYGHAYRHLRIQTYIYVFILIGRGIVKVMGMSVVGMGLRSGYVQSIIYPACFMCQMSYAMPPHIMQCVAHHATGVSHRFDLMLPCVSMKRLHAHLLMAVPLLLPLTTQAGLITHPDI